MIKIKPIVKIIVLEEIEAYFALINGYMNMSSYAHRIRSRVEGYTKKEVTITSLVVSLSRLKSEFKKEKPLIPEIYITNITTKLPLSEVVYENTEISIEKLQTIYKKVSIKRDNFFTATIGTTEIDIISSSEMITEITKYFKIKPKQLNHHLAAVGISLDPKCFNTPNTFFALFSIIARARVNIEEIVSTATELIFIIKEKDFSKTITLFSELNRNNK